MMHGSGLHQLHVSSRQPAVCRQHLSISQPQAQQHHQLLPLLLQQHPQQQRNTDQRGQLAVTAAAGSPASCLSSTQYSSRGSTCGVASQSQQQLSRASGAQLRHEAPSSRPPAVAAAAAAGGSGSPAWGQQQQQQQAGRMPSPPPIIDPNSIDPNGLAGLFMAYAMQLQQSMQQQEAAAGPSPGANVVVKGLGFHPPGAENPLLDDVSFHLKPNQLGLIIGRSGSGKTTLLQLLAGLSEQTSGQIFIHRPAAGDHASGLFLPTHIEQRMQQVGLVFQFPERHFLGDDVMQEMTFTWPRDMAYWGQRQALAVRMQRVIDAVGLSDIPFNISPTALSGGQQRRLALALQLVRAPSLLLLDEPLAGLDWHARREVVALLRELKKEATLLVVSHDLADIAPLVDCAWRMQMGGRMDSVEWPPDSLSDMED